MDSEAPGAMTNDFPSIWFQTFLAPDNASPVHRELEFIQRYLPVSEFPRVLDIPCGIGRHAGPLAALGYEVLGVDRSEEALAVARVTYPDVEFRQLDMFELSSLNEEFDALLCLWQSFGYGDSIQNRDVLTEMRRRLRPGGRLLLDVYNAEAVKLLPRRSEDVRNGRTVRTRRVLGDRRLSVELRYSDSQQVDMYDWEIYTPSELTEIATEADLNHVLDCAWFDPTILPSPEDLRMQLLFERPGELSD